MTTTTITNKLITYRCHRAGQDLSVDVSILVSGSSPGELEHCLLLKRAELIESGLTILSCVGSRAAYQNEIEAAK